MTQPLCDVEGCMEPAKHRWQFKHAVHTFSKVKYCTEHHHGRGVQCPCGEYVGTLEEE